MKRSFVLLNSLLFIFSSAWSEMVFSGTLETKTGAYVPESSFSGEYSEGEISFRPKLDAYWENTSLLISGKSGVEILENSKKEKIYGKLDEAYFDYNGGFWSFRCGRQIVSWGAGDSFIATNIICPDDNTKLSGTSVNDSKIGIDGIKISFNTDSLLMDAYFIPVFSKSSMPFSSGSRLHDALIPSSLDFSAAGLGVLGINEIEDEKFETKKAGFKSAEYGLRISSFHSFADFSFYGFYGWDNEPLLEYSLDSPSSISISGKYKRVTMIGADASVPAGPVTLRAESAFYPKRFFACSAESQLGEIFMSVPVNRSEQHNQLCGILGVDWMPSDWTFSIQYFADYVSGNTDKIGRKNLKHKSSFSAGYSFDGGIVTAELSGIISLNDFDSVLVPQISYSYTDQIKFILSAMFFNEGKEKGEYGMLKDLSSVTLSASLSF